MNKYNKEGQRHGLCEWYHENDKLTEIEYYIN